MKQMLRWWKKNVKHGGKWISLVYNKGAEFGNIDGGEYTETTRYNTQELKDIW